MAELDAFHGWLKKELLDKLLSSDYADVFLDGSSWDGSGSRKYFILDLNLNFRYTYLDFTLRYFNMGVWYPDRVNYGRKDTSESNEKVLTYAIQHDARD